MPIWRSGAVLRHVLVQRHQLCAAALSHEDDPFYLRTVGEIVDRRRHVREEVVHREPAPAVLAGARQEDTVPTAREVRLAVVP